MFLLAFFYDIQWPSDDGTCGTLDTSQTLCESRKTYFDSTERMCRWLLSDDQSGNAGSCVWVEPSYNPNILVAISILVVAISGPIYFIISYLFTRVLLAPTLDDVSQRTVDKDTRRKSAIDLLNSANNQTFGVSNRRKLIGTEDLKNHAKRRNAGIKIGSKAASGKVSVFKQSAFIAEHVSRGRMHAQRATQSFGDLSRTLALVGHTRQQPGLETDVHALLEEPQFDLKELRGAVQGHYIKTNPRERNNFKLLWPAELFEPGATELLHILHVGESKAADTDRLRTRSAYNSRSAASAIVPLPQSIVEASTAGSDALNAVDMELKSVKREADEWIQKIKSMNAAHAGIHILTLFMRDLLGRETNRCRIFLNQMKIISEETVVTWGVKACALTCVFFINGFFIYSCMLYGRAKGLRWQQGWLIASVVNLVLDIVIKQANIAAIVYYVIPDLITDTAQSLRVNLEQSISAMCTNHANLHMLHLTHNQRQSQRQSHELEHAHGHGHGQGQGQGLGSAAFSASDYFFVSTRVARAYPGLLESAIVLSYRCPTVSTELREKWGLVTRHSNSFLNKAYKYMSSFDLTSLLALLITTLLMQLGAQSVLVQRVVVMSLNPAIIAVIAFFGSALLHNPLLGTLLVLACILALGVGIYAVYVKSWKPRGDNNGTVIPLVQSLEESQQKTSPENELELVTLKKNLLDVRGTHGTHIINGDDKEIAIGPSSSSSYSRDNENYADSINLPPSEDDLLSILLSSASDEESSDVGDSDLEDHDVAVASVDSRDS